MAAPYRIPVWTELGRYVDLIVGLLESNDSLRSDPSANRGHDWLHRTQEGVKYLELPNFKLHRGEARFYVPRDLSLFCMVRQSDVVLLGGWESPAYWFGLIATFIVRKRRVAFYESHQGTMRHLRGPAAWARAAFFRSMHAVVTPGPSASASIISMGVPRTRVFEGFNAVDVHAFYQASRAVQEPRTVGQAGHEFLYVGQLIERKRVSEIVEAFQEGAEHDDSLTLIGAGVLESGLKSKISLESKRITIHPVVENRELPHIMAKHKTLVLASSSEVWGLVVNEALASGMHVVVTANCGVAESVARMRGVFLASPDLSDLAVKMKESRAAWAGRIANPEILQYTPAKFAEKFSEAFASTRTNVGESLRDNL